MLDHTAQGIREKDQTITNMKVTAMRVTLQLLAAVSAVSAASEAGAAAARVRRTLVRKRDQPESASSAESAAPNPNSKLHPSFSGKVEHLVAGTGDPLAAKVAAKGFKLHNEGPDGVAKSRSMAMESVFTFVTVFGFGCAIVGAVFAWKRLTDSSLR